MRRKRAKGGGRKSRAGPTSPLTFRIPDDLRRELELEATKDGSVSERLLWHLRRSIDRKREEERDPALKALLLLIARLAEDITGGEYLLDRDVRSEIQSQWRTNLFEFQAFKFAVKKLLDTLEEPPEEPPEYRITEEQREQIERESAEYFWTDAEFTQLLRKINKSPEAKGAWVFGNVWKRFTHSHLPFTESERRMIREQPILGRAMEREYHDFQKARKALELKPPSEDLSEAIKRIMKDRNLDPEKEPPPPDVQEAIKLIADKGQAHHEARAAKKLPTREALKLLRSDPLPTLDEALMLIKIRKRKGHFAAPGKTLRPFSRSAEQR
jgi:hypothetical protein